MVMRRLPPSLAVGGENNEHLYSFSFSTTMEFGGVLVVVEIDIPEIALPNYWLGRKLWRQLRLSHCGLDDPGGHR